VSLDGLYFDHSGPYLDHHGDELEHLKLGEVPRPPEILSSCLHVLAKHRGEQIMRVHQHVHERVQRARIVRCAQTCSQRSALDLMNRSVHGLQILRSEVMRGAHRHRLAQRMQLPTCNNCQGDQCLGR